VNFEAFRYRLERTSRRSDSSRGGHLPYDPVLMFKILVLQAPYNLSDEQTKFQVRDRLFFMWFLGSSVNDPVPEATTTRLFRECLTRTKAIEKIFTHFDKILTAKGYLAVSGQILDGSIIAALRQRNTNGEKGTTKEGRIPEGQEDHPAKLRRKNRDARWALSTIA